MIELLWFQIHSDLVLIRRLCNLAHQDKQKLGDPSITIVKALVQQHRKEHGGFKDKHMTNCKNIDSHWWRHFLKTRKCKHSKVVNSLPTRLPEQWLHLWCRFQWHRHTLECNTNRQSMLQAPTWIQVKDSPFQANIQSQLSLCMNGILWVISMWLHSRCASETEIPRNIHTKNDILILLS